MSDSPTQTPQTPAAPEPALLDRDQSALYLGGISTRKVDLLADEKWLERIYIGRRVFFRKSDLERFARRGTVRGTVRGRSTVRR